MHGVEHGTDALKSGVLQSEHRCKHVETHEATLLERFQNTLQRTGHDPTGQWEKQEPMFSFLQSLIAGFFPDHAARPMNARESGEQRGKAVGETLPVSMSHVLAPCVFSLGRL
jgi:hypothetical protein